MSGREIVCVWSRLHQIAEIWHQIDDPSLLQKCQFCMLAMYNGYMHKCICVYACVYIYLITPIKCICTYYAYIFSCDHAALQMVFSACLSVRLSHLFDYVPIIISSWNFQELLPMTKVRSMQKVKVRGQRSRSLRSQPNLTVSGL